MTTPILPFMRCAIHLIHPQLGAELTRYWIPNNTPLMVMYVPMGWWGDEKYFHQWEIKR